VVFAGGGVTVALPDLGEVLVKDGQGKVGQQRRNNAA